MNKKILIVDDEHDIVKVIKDSLGKKGFDIIEAYDGFEGLEKVQTEKPDIILLDIMMPKMDGYSFNDKLKKSAEAAGIPVIVITGRGLIKQLLEAVESKSIDAFLLKPFTIPVLLEKINEVLAKYQKIHQVAQIAPNTVDKKI